MTKARTLERLSSVLTNGRVLPLAYFTVGRWQEARGEVLRDLAGLEWIEQPLIVRSSALVEDAVGASAAGKFLSVHGVEGLADLESAIDRVATSYGDGASTLDEVLVQPLLRQVSMSGVAFTADPTSGAPYRVVEWVDSADTTAVTGGKSARQFYESRGAKSTPIHLLGVMALLDELETIVPNQPLDVEFAVSGSEVFLLQVRPLVMRTALLSVEEHTSLLSEIATKVSEGTRPHPFLCGRRTIYGVMPDWNPAEIIGIRPRPLALSLYRELVTDTIWAYQRSNYGYKNLRSHPLLRHFHGLPYIDVRVCFNSFVPKDVETPLANRLVDYYLDLLQSQPELHDKVEFEVVLSCYSLDLPRRMDRLRAAGFTVQDCEQLTQSLRHLTNSIVNPKTGLWRTDQARIDVLTERREALSESGLDPVSRIYWLLEDCKRYGTLPFAGLARAGFIAIQMLRSLVAIGVLSKEDHDGFINSLDTVSGQLPRDFAALDPGVFLEKYGHLRPGTYDILSLRYDEAPEAYFDWTRRTGSGAHEKLPFCVSLPQMREIARLLKAHELDVDAIGLFDFLQAGIELRESSKFEFTRNVSEALRLMVALGEEMGFSRDDLSYTTVASFYELHAGSSSPRTALAREIEEGRERYSQTCRLVLPPLIVSDLDVWSFEMPATDPNFVTQKRVTAEVTASLTAAELRNRIVCIRSADPGFDWLFSHDIAGLVTAYGGANSHMAIRANELGLPAVIGSGEIRFQKWSAARLLSIDCANRKVDVLT